MVPLFRGPNGIVGAGGIRPPAQPLSNVEFPHDVFCRASH